MTKKEMIQQQIRIIKSKIFLDPRIDAVFKKLFSHSRFLIHFLNVILHLPRESLIVSAVYKKVTVKLTSKAGGEETRFDIHAKLNNGKFVDLEMQRARHSDFLDRVELYGSQLSINSKISFDRKRSEKELKAHPYLMPQTFSVWICDFPVPFCNSYREEIALYRASDVGKKGALPVYKKKNYIIVDLTKYFGRKSTEAQWLRLLKGASTARATPKGSNKVVADAYNSIKVDEASDKFIKEIANNMVTQAEIYTRLNDAKVQGYEEGLLQGHSKAIITMVKRMLAAKESIKKIQRYSGLSIAEIKAL